MKKRGTENSSGSQRRRARQTAHRALCAASLAMLIGCDKPKAATAVEGNGFAKEASAHDHADHAEAAEGVAGTKEASAHDHADHAEGHDHSAHAETPVADWCAEHKVPESKCTTCNPALAAGFKAKGDWCGEHGFPESVCPVCSPQTPPAGVAASVALSGETQVASGIVAKAAQAGPLPVRFTIPCEVRFNPDRIAHISPMAAGQIFDVKATVGDRVKRGDVLTHLRSAVIGQARATQTKAHAHLRAAEKALSSQRRLRASGISSERDLVSAELEFARARADKAGADAEISVYGVDDGAGADIEIRSPIDGVVIERHATPGEYVTTVDTLFVVANTEQVWVVGQAYDRHLAALVVGMKATVKLHAFPDRRWPRDVTYIAASLDDKTRTAGVRVLLDNPDGIVRPGLFGELELETAPSAAIGAVIEADAVQQHDGRTIVFRQNPDGKAFEVVPVIVLRRTRELVEVVGTDDNVVAAGDRIVVQGAFVLKSDLVKGSLADSCGGH